MKKNLATLFLILGLVGSTPIVADPPRDVESFREIVDTHLPDDVRDSIDSLPEDQRRDFWEKVHHMCGSSCCTIGKTGCVWFILLVITIIQFQFTTP